MKRYTFLRLLCCVLLLAALPSCATSAPEIVPELSQPDEILSPLEPTVEDSFGPGVSKEPLPIPPYQASTVFPASTHILNLPEVILTANQTYERALYCIDKKTGTSRIFCYDPTCVHENCTSHHFSHPKNLIYAHYNGSLYGNVDVDVHSNRTLLYRIDGNSFLIECVWWGNGQPIREQKAVHQNYLYFSTQGKYREINIFRMSLDDHTVEQMLPPEGKTFCDFMISSGVFLARFRQGDEYYRTDEHFSQYTPTGLYSIAYLNGEEYIKKITRQPTPEEAGTTDEYTVGYALGNLSTHDETQICTSEQFLKTLGFDGEYIYYRYSSSRPNQYVANHTLYRVNVRTGQAEQLCRYDDGLVLEVACYDGVIYYYKEDAAKEVYTYTKALLYGRLVRAETTLLAKDFPIYYPTAVIERVTAPK
ncbi:MAG: hypothetical protein IJY66_02730 [Clostridia bacterium]|nr:hypothetical protein [Clostridia bacterium]